MLLKTTSMTQIHTHQIIKERKSYQKMDLFFSAQPDLYLILSDKIYPCHKKVLNNSQYVKKTLDEDQKILIIDFQINQNCFDMCLGYLYSSELNFQRTKEIFQILSISQKMGINNLFQSIVNDFKQNFQEYNLFKLYSTSIKYRLQQLREYCEQELMKLSYQQMNIHRLDLLQMDKQALQQMIRNHQKLKVNKVIDGISRSQMQQIVSQYNKFHHMDINIEELLTIKQEYYDFDRKQVANYSLNSKRGQKKSIIKRKSISCNLQTLDDDNQDKSKSISQRVQVFQKNQCKIQSENEDNLAKFIQIRDKYLDIQYVESPVIDLAEFQSKEISFQSLTWTNENQFIGNKQINNNFGYISERNSSQQCSRELTSVELSKIKETRQQK